MKILVTLTIAAAFVSTLPIVKAAEPIPMTAEHWRTAENAEFLKVLGFPRGLMRLNSGNAALKDVSFSDGTIEFDIKPIGRDMPGVIFRQQDDATYELFYLRPDPDCPAYIACLQYAPQTHGVQLWDLFLRYETSAPLLETGWNHIKMVISGRRMNVFVNRASSPTLQVGRLEGDALEGGIRLVGPATFANVVISPGAVEGLSPDPVKDPTDDDRRLVRNWQLSAFSPLPQDKEPAFTEMPDATKPWKSLSAERNGLMNLSREYGLPLRPNRAVAWLKTTIHSDRSQTKNIGIGWTREVWVFVNGKLVFADKNLWEPASARKAPEGRCSPENGSFTLPLVAGDNEVAVALADDFFGWGLILRLADLEGVHLAPK